MKDRLLFCNRKNRDNYARELKAQGYKVRRTSTRNQLIHPEYIHDYNGYYETGFGNGYYKTHFGVLYIVEMER